MIKELYAWVVDDPTGEHGIIAIMLGPLPMQAVSSKLRLAAALESEVQHVKDDMMIGRPVHLVRFTSAEIVKTLENKCQL